MKRGNTRAALFLCALALIGCKKEGATQSGAASPDTPKSGAKVQPVSLPTGSGPYDVITRAYSPYTDADDPVGYPMKVRNLTSNAYRFWRGSKELFYTWCKTHTQDWLDDKPAYPRIHGDLHPGNMGLYHSEGKFGHHVAFGAVDFDDSARLPFQLELLEGVITLDLLARHRQIALSSDQSRDVITTLLDAYKSSLTSDQTPTQMLEDDVWVGKMLKEARKHDYSDELDKYVQKDHFVSMIVDKSGRVKEVLRQLKGKGGFADAIEEALQRSPDARDLFKEADVRKKSVEDIARRTQLESAGSEGLHKYLVLLANKKVQKGRLILYLKEQIPSSAERVELIAKDPRSAGRRSSEDMHDLSHPPAYFNSWCDWNGGSYKLSIKEPWSETMDAANVDTFEDLKHVARIWGIVAGSVHRQGAEIVQTIVARLTPELAESLQQRAAAYSKETVNAFRDFTRDARTRDQVTRAEAGLKELEAKSR